jgi:4-hydroxybenzoate polyprenyltransferase
MAKEITSLSEVTDNFLDGGSQVPLIVDLDGTLFTHDIFTVQFLSSLFRKPSLFVKALLSVLSGDKAAAKNLFVQEGHEIDFDSWPVNTKLEQELLKAQEAGRTLILCSGSQEHYVLQAQQSKNYFSTSHGSTLNRNLTGTTKRDLLIELFGEGGFDYIGNSRADRPIYEVARAAYSTHAFHDNLTGAEPKRWRLWLRQLRVKHWTKNLLLFLPLIAAYDFRLESFLSLTLFFVLFSLQASGTYLINDLLDLQSDFLHPDKAGRPLAAGAISPLAALFLAGVLITVPSLLAVLFISQIWAYLLLAYLVTTLFYSIVGKRLLGLDVVLLAVLYTFRIFSGIVVLQAELSVWLLVLSFLLFYSMASVKRFIELVGVDKNTRIPGRGYLGIDAETVAQIGTASGVAGVVVYTLFVTIGPVSVHYELPAVLLIGAPILMYWVTHLWVSARRNLIHSDPIDWALKDRTSWVTFALFIAVAIGTWGLNWLV